MFKSNCILFFLLLVAACSPVDKKTETESRNKKTVQAYVDTVWNNKQLDSLEIYFSGTFLRKVNNIALDVDKAELTASINILFTSFPDLQMDIEYILAATNKVFMNWTITGTNTGNFSDYPATGNKVKISGISRIDLNEEGKITYINLFYNELSLMQQLGHTLTKPQIE